MSHIVLDHERGLSVNDHGYVKFRGGSWDCEELDPRVLVAVNDAIVMEDDEKTWTLAWDSPEWEAIVRAWADAKDAL